MNRSITMYRQQQEEVNAYFQHKSLYWKDIYAGNSVSGEIYRERQATTLAWIDELALAPGSKVLEIGCGAGFLSVALAQRGLDVQAIDSAEAMVELARRHAQEVGVTKLMTVNVGDVYDLAFAHNSFDLVIALGVLPWLTRPKLAIREMIRVVRPGGHILLTADNKERLDNLLDPLLNPLIVPTRKRMASLLKRAGLRRQSTESLEATYYSRRFIDNTLTRAGLTKIKGLTIGFGPLTFLRRTILPEPFSIKLHHRLQSLADRNTPILRATGIHYLVLTRKPTSGTTSPTE